MFEGYILPQEFNILEKRGQVNRSHNMISDVFIWRLEAHLGLMDWQ